MQILQDIDLYNNDVSSYKNFQEDPNFIPPSPHLKKTKSLSNISGAKNVSEISDIEDEPTTNIEQSSQDSEIDCHKDSITKYIYIYIHIYIYIYIYGKMAFSKMQKRYFPVEKLNCSFESSDYVKLD